MIIFGGRSNPSESIFKPTRPVILYFESKFCITYLRSTGIISWQRRKQRQKGDTLSFQEQGLTSRLSTHVCLLESKSYWDDTVEEECTASWYAFSKRFSPLMSLSLHKICRKWTLPLFINTNWQLKSEIRCLVLDCKCIWQENSICSRHKHQTNTSLRDWIKTEGCIFSLRHPSSSQVLSQSLPLVIKVRSLS